MKINRLLLLGISLAGIFIYVSCRKIDKEVEKISVNDLEKKFFKSHAPDNPLVIALNNFLQKENTKYHFVEKTVKQIGFPRWNKAIIVYKSGSSGRGASDSASLTFVPFVRETDNFVNASLMIQTSNDDTAYQWLCDWQYAEYLTDTASGVWNARDIFHVFSALDKEVFDRNQFRIVDERLLTAQEISAIDSAGLDFDSVEVHYTLSPVQQNQGRNNILLPVTFCQNVTVCVLRPGVNGCSESGRNHARVSVVPGCCLSLIFEICTTEWVWIPGSGGGGGT